MKDHFVRIIFTEEQDKDFIRIFAGAMASTVNESLLESEQSVIFEQYETTEGHYVYEVPLTHDLDDKTAEEMVDRISKAIPGTYDIEVSGEGHTIQ